jgi:hypothetical protein
MVSNKLTLSASAPAPLLLTVGPGSTITGSVSDLSGKPVPHVPVLLLPEKSERRNLLNIRRSSTDDSGNFSLRGVAPGITSSFRTGAGRECSRVAKRRGIRLGIFGRYHQYPSPIPRV